MPTSKADIIAQLQKEILPLQGFKAALHNTIVDVGLGQIKNAFPNNQFPLGAIHEFVAAGAEDAAVSAGFIAAILASLMANNGAVIWAGTSINIFPPALRPFGIPAHKIIFISLPNEKQLAWVIEEALKCKGLSAVVAELQDLSFTTSRRLQLAVEQSQVTGFILRKSSQNISTTAAVARWQITSLPSDLQNGMPGVGFPRWNVSLLKVRNGKPGNWQLEFAAGSLHHIPAMPAITAIPFQQQKKTG